MTDDKKMKEIKLNKRRKIALFLITILIILLLGIAAITTYEIINKENKGDINEKQVNSSCIKITPTIEGYKYTVSNIGSTCAVLKINDNFNLKYEINDDEYKLYVNNVYIKTDVYMHPIVYYISDKGIITENASSTCGIPNLIFITKKGVALPISLQDGMCPKTENVTISNGKLIVDATSNCGCNSELDSQNNTYNPSWYVDDNRYISLLSKSNNSTNIQLSFDELINKYNIPEDFVVEAQYTYNLSPNNFNFIVEIKKTIRHLYDEYSNNFNFN